MDAQEKSRILAELLRLHRWAGGETVSAARIFGLMHGFETVMRQEYESFGISEQTQELVEDMLEDVENERQGTDGLSIKSRLHGDGVDEVDAAKVMRLCRLQSRFPDAIDKIINGRGAVFSYLNNDREPEQDWAGALHFMELIDCTENVHTKMHAVFSPVVPRIGEIVTPQSGSTMRVVDVEHIVVSQGYGEGIKRHFQMIPHVYLEAIADEEEE